MPREPYQRQYPHKPYAPKDKPKDKQEVFIKEDPVETWAPVTFAAETNMKKRIKVAALNEGVTVSAFMRGLFLAYEAYQQERGE